MHTSNSVEVDEDHDEITCLLIDTKNSSFSEIDELNISSSLKQGCQKKVSLAAVRREEVLIEQQEEPCCEEMEEKIFKGSESHYGEK